MIFLATAVLPCLSASCILLRVYGFLHRLHLGLVTSCPYPLCTSIILSGGCQTPIVPCPLHLLRHPVASRRAALLQDIRNQRKVAESRFGRGGTALVLCLRCRSTVSCSSLSTCPLTSRLRFCRCYAYVGNHLHHPLCATSRGDRQAVLVIVSTF